MTNASSVARVQQHTTEAESMNVPRMAILAISHVAIALSLLFKERNLVFHVSLAYNVAVSANFPPRALSMYWKGFANRGPV
ncbi:hypothetical protein WT24_13550 [Burkholderia sp. MSMB1078WGS]|uniref:sodium:solute symporter family transporter n=1 Tax=Burkholderia sp. MSMB1078WGS TaxID=1637900 RepID=UPI0007521795|nr:hypothetical protein WT24_13550 [Burkholderia sp. MSMB1078WGS]